MAYSHPAYFLQLPEGHPFPMEKFTTSREALSSDAEIEIRESPEAEWEDLLRVHSEEYLQRVQTSQLSRRELTRLGLPQGEELLRRCRLETGGTICAVEEALETGLAFNLGGGTHHAMRAEGLGYCVLNDVAVAIQREFKRRDLFVFILDTDAHQGNGTHALLANDERVFCSSVHVGRNYPARKVAGSRDVELSRYAGGGEYMEALAGTLPEDLERHEPDLVIWIGGADIHANDRFGQMTLTDEDIAERDLFILDQIQQVGAALCSVYGGGYNREAVKTSMIHVETVRRCVQFFAAD